MPELCDIGVNLCDRSFRDDLPDVLERAAAAGVGKMVVTGTTVKGSKEAAALATLHPHQLWATAGVHPHHAKDCNESTISELRQIANDRKVVAIGECGLDYNRNFSPPKIQREYFEKQVQLACELDMPLFLHERDALDDQLAILRNYREQFDKAVIHCFTGGRDALEAYLSLDLYIGITGWICDERRGGHLHELVRDIPDNRLMLETDAPYLMPRTIRPRPKTRRNEPANLPYVLETLAQCLGQEAEALATQSTKVACDFFGI